jgi:hypothetical protein
MAEEAVGRPGHDPTRRPLIAAGASGPTPLMAVTVNVWRIQGQSESVRAGRRPDSAALTHLTPQAA